jgi:hypothetical protein
MSEMSGAETARRLVTRYQQGMITETEFVVSLLEAANRFDPADMVGHLPEPLLAAVREAAEFAPADGTGIPPIWCPRLLSAEEIESRRESARDGAWLWFQYFNSRD